MCRYEAFNLPISAIVVEVRLIRPVLISESKRISTLELLHCTQHGLQTLYESSQVHVYIKSLHHGGCSGIGVDILPFLTCRCPFSPSMATVGYIVHYMFCTKHAHSLCCTLELLCILLMVQHGVYCVSTVQALYLVWTTPFMIGMYTVCIWLHFIFTAFHVHNILCQPHYIVHYISCLPH